MLPQYETMGKAVQQKELKVRAGLFPKNRARLDVIAEILRACSGVAANKSAILLKANLNSVTATCLLKHMLDSGLLDMIVDEEKAVTYIATSHGTSFLERYSDLTAMLAQELTRESKPAKLNQPNGIFV